MESSYKQEIALTR